jgi:serine/threonine protein phosphatase PrpC
MGNYQAFAITKPGSSHKKSGKECQDYSHRLPWTSCKNDKAMAAVADGHGDDSCFRSQKGAELACLRAINGIREFVINFQLSQEKDKDKEIKTLIKHIICEWQVCVEDDYNKDKERDKKSNFKEKELILASEKRRKQYENGEALNRAYGTTLIAAAVTGDYWFGIHIGDGRFTVLNQDGSFEQPVPWDDRCFLNATTSICDDDAAERARYFFSLNSPENPPPAAVFLCSDGVDDNYPVEENEKYLYELCRKITRAFAEDGFVSAKKQLEDLVEKFANEGKGDDTSVAGFIDMEKLDEIVRKWNEEDNEKAEAKKSVPENTAIEYVGKPNTTTETIEEIPTEIESAIKTEN